MEVQLTGEDGNAFAIIGAVCRGLIRAGLGDEATAWTNTAMTCASYDELLQLAMRTVTVT